VNIIPIFL